MTAYATSAPRRPPDDLAAAFVEACNQATGTRARFTGREWLLTCPNHDDRQPSLSVRTSERDGKVLINCHAFCDSDDVIAAVGWQWADLRPVDPDEDRRSTPPVRRIERHRSAQAEKSEYLYTDADGVTTFCVRVTRYPDKPKKVTQHAALPNGGWDASLGDTQRVLYRLPRVIRAVQALAPVWITEGEKCADALEAQGLIATTNPGGAGKWRPEYAEALRSAHVFVLPDNDEPGRKHADHVMASLTGIAATVTRVELPGLPPKGDVADWLAAGHTRDELLELVATAPAARTASQHASKPYEVFPAPTHLDHAAYHGILGETLRLLEGTTEAEPAAILAHLLVGFGVMCGPNPYVRAGNERQKAKTFAVVCGDTALARKGTAWGDARMVLDRADHAFLAAGYVTGLSTGEGLIYRLRDPEQATLDAPGDGADPKPMRDPRLLVVEPEWAKLLRLDKRQGNTLSAVVREAWDNSALGTLTISHGGMQASLHHIGIVGHITGEELRAELDTVSAANGFANRHLLIHVTRRQWLPDPAPVNDVRLGLIAHQLRTSAQAAAERREVIRTSAAAELWADQMYRDLDQTTHRGIAGHWMARGPAQVLRLALIYALADEADHIDVPHLQAARAVWEYHRQSVLHIFGAKLGDPVADRLLAAVRSAGPDGLDGTAQYAVFDNNVPKEALTRARELLHAMGLVEVRSLPSGPSGGRRRSVLVPV